MAVKNFVFRQKWVGRKVAGMKKTFFAFLTQPGPTFWTQKTQIKNSLNSILVKKDRNYIIINFVNLKLTNQSEIIENNQFFAIWSKINFCPIFAKLGKNLVLTSFKFGIFSYNCHKFPLRWF